MSPKGKYEMSLDELEQSAHVPPEEQVEMHPEPALPDIVSEDERWRQEFLRVAG